VTTGTNPTVATNECSNPGTGWIFCDDFETDRTAKYFEYDNAGGKFVRATSTGVGGSTGMRATYTKGQANAGSLHLAFGRTPSSYFRPADAGTANYREIYWRFFVKRDAGWVGNGADKLTRATVFAKSDWSQAMIAQAWSDGTDLRYLLLDPASGTDSKGTLKTAGYNDFNHLVWMGGVRSATQEEAQANVGNWECYEFHVKLNDAGKSNGAFDFAVNGQTSAAKSGMNWLGAFNTYGLNAVYLEQYQNAGAPANNVRTLDNFVVSTQPIGCGNGSTAPAAPTSPAAPTTSTVSVSPAASRNAVGATVQLSATVKDANGNTVNGKTATWTSSDASIASVSSTGYVAMLTPGTATITATIDGVAGQATITPVALPATKVSLAIDSATIGVSSQAHVTSLVYDLASAIMSTPLTWSSSAPGVATVSSTGVVRGVAAGSATITAVTSNGITGSVAVTVRGAATVAVASQVAITMQPSTIAQGGVALAQQPVVQLRDGSGKVVSTAGVVVTASIGTGGGTLGGTATATTDATGSARFVNLSITGTDGSRTLKFSAGSLVAATSSVIAVTTTAAAPPQQLAAGAGSCPNEPSGYSAVNDQPWDQKPVRGSSSPMGWIDDGGNGNSAFSIINDPTSPMAGSNHNVISALFPAGSPGGSATFYTYRPFSSTEQYKDLYICLYLKHDANFDNTNGNTGSKFIWPAGDQVGGAMTYTSHDNATMDFAMIQQGPVDRIMEANMNYNSARMASFKGQWVRYEMLLKANSNNSTANGALDIWINGVHTHSYTNVNWQMGASRTWQSLAWNPTYGGGLNPVPHNQYQYMDNIHVSGSNQ
jgi:uncharacterized protein YjdB